ncbi:lysozyme inhibitor LprI family protein [Aquirhabdus sp.]|uniref:lysozyme inhibitor LprI family protein n=1 Tax=Aquirhabdus sp. TaxID=2824160 RepID=UPI00396C7740
MGRVFGFTKNLKFQAIQTIRTAETNTAPTQQNTEASQASATVNNSPSNLSASFNCEFARTSVEHIICNDLQLIAADSKLNSEYAALKKTDDLKHEQRGWLHARNQCTNTECIRQLYKTRTDELSGRLSGEQSQ